MFALLDTLVKGSKARAEDRVRDAFAIDVIEQKVRDAEVGLRSAKDTLALLTLRLRRERTSLADVRKNIADLEKRAVAALDAGREELAKDAADAVAELENERDQRAETVNRIDRRVERMRLSIEKAQRRLLSLKQGALTARSVDAERRAQKRLNRAIGTTDDFAEAEELIQRVLGQDDPLEASEIRREIDRELGHENVADRLADEGFGASRRSTGGTVLERLRSRTGSDGAEGRSPDLTTEQSTSKMKDDTNG